MVSLCGHQTLHKINGVTEFSNFVNENEFLGIFSKNLNFYMFCDTGTKFHKHLLKFYTSFTDVSKWWSGVNFKETNFIK